MSALWETFARQGEEVVRERLASNAYNDLTEKQAREWLAHQASSKVSADSRALLDSAASANDLAREANDVAREANALAREANASACEANNLASRANRRALIANVIAAIAAAAAIAAIVIPTIIESSP